MSLSLMVDFVDCEVRVLMNLVSTSSHSSSNTQAVLIELGSGRLNYPVSFRNYCYFNLEPSLVRRVRVLLNSLQIPLN